MIMEKAIIVENVYKKYKLYNDTKERLLDLVTPKKYGEEFYALTDVNFEAEKGDSVGFIGINGSGKSTLSNIIAGIVPQTTGTVKVNGQAALIAVAAGLKGDLTGRDNIELKLLMLGFNKEEILALEPSIIEFAELEKFIDQPVKSYSSGMKSRLGFAISVNVNPDILIIDEALSVGDKAFAEKSFNKMKEFKQDGKTMIFVSHSISQMRRFCEKILWLEYGMVKDYGTVEEIIPKYEDFLIKWQKMDRESRESYKKIALENQKKLLSGLKVNKNVKIDDFYKGEVNNEYVERPISILGHIRTGESYIYSSPKDPEDSMSSNKYKNAVYFVKKQATYKGELYYLLSNNPSSSKGIIGWMKAKDMSVHRHVAVDNDIKTFKVKGLGKAYSKPWGGKKNCLIENLNIYKNQDYLVDRTDLVGRNVWYRGYLNEQTVWIHQNHLL